MCSHLCRYICVHINTGYEGLLCMSSVCLYVLCWDPSLEPRACWSGSLTVRLSYGFPVSASIQSARATGRHGILIVKLLTAA